MMEKPKILIVDDEKDIREILRKFLSRDIECDISEADSGRKVFEILKKEAFDLIILDIKMPGLSGIDVLKQVRSTHPQTDVLVISAWDSQSVATEALKAGAGDYITKPFTMQVACAKVSEVLKKKNKYIPKKKENPTQESNPT